MTPLATYFSKSKLMARFQSHLGIGFHTKEDIIGALEVPDDVLYQWCKLKNEKWNIFTRSP